MAVCQQRVSGLAGAELRFGAELHTEGSVPGALGPCSPRSADGPMIIISRPLSYLTTSSRTANSCFARFTASAP